MTPNVQQLGRKHGIIIAILAALAVIIFSFSRNHKPVSETPSEAEQAFDRILMESEVSTNVVVRRGSPESEEILEGAARQLLMSSLKAVHRGPYDNSVGRVMVGYISFETNGTPPKIVGVDLGNICDFFGYVFYCDSPQRLIPYTNQDLISMELELSTKGKPPPGPKP